MLPQLGTFDLVLTDPPYGTTAIAWDHAIDLERWWQQVDRLTDAAVITSRQPFTSRLIMSNAKNYRHGWIWDKQFAGAFVLANVQPMQIHEDVSVFAKKAAPYKPQMERRSVPIKLGGKNPGPGSPIASELPNQKTYDSKYPESILRISNRTKERGLHPTQKPVRLFGYLLTTYTNAGNSVCDPFMGSGTTLLAAKDLGRRAVGIEIEERYCEIAANRLRQGVLPFAG